MKKTYMIPNAAILAMNISDITTTSQTLSLAEDVIVDNFGGASNGYERLF